MRRKFLFALFADFSAKKETLTESQRDAALI